MGEGALIAAAASSDLDVEIPEAVILHLAEDCAAAEDSSMPATTAGVRAFMLFAIVAACLLRVLWLLSDLKSARQHAAGACGSLGVVSN